MINLIPYKQILHSNGKKKEAYYLIVDQIEPLGFEELCKLIAERTTLSPNEVEFVVNEIVDVAIENFEIGRGINLGNLGVATPVVEARSVEKEEDLDISTIRGLRFHFLASLKIRKALKEMRMRVKRDYYAKYKAEKEGQASDKES